MFYLLTKRRGEYKKVVKRIENLMVWPGMSLILTTCVLIAVSGMVSTIYCGSSEGGLLFFCLCSSWCLPCYFNSYLFVSLIFDPYSLIPLFMLCWCCMFSQWFMIYVFFYIFLVALIYFYLLLLSWKGLLVC